MIFIYILQGFLIGNLILSFAELLVNLFSIE